MDQCEEQLLNGVSHQKTLKTYPSKDDTFKMTIVWKNALGFLVLHVIGLYALYVVFSGLQVTRFMFQFVFGMLSGVGVTVGGHRLFTHRCYTASRGLSAVLLLLHTVAGQNCLYIWVRDHRQHHMYSDTIADPHNSTRGFFFSHIGWLMVRKHPAVIAAGKTVDMSDLEADPLVMFQKKYYKTLYTVFAFLFPVGLHCLLWNDSILTSVLNNFARTIVVLNITWTVNSFAHLYGTHPYDSKLKPVENSFVAMITFGEGWHNYHHAFPFDYRTSEFGMKYNWNAYLIECFEKMGWASNLRSVSKTVVMDKVLKNGDGSHHLWGSIRPDVSHTFG